MNNSQENCEFTFQNEVHTRSHEGSFVNYEFYQQSLQTYDELGIWVVNYFELPFI